MDAISEVDFGALLRHAGLNLAPETSIGKLNFRSADDRNGGRVSSVFTVVHQGWH
jgi:hypothetical protein